MQIAFELLEMLVETWLATESPETIGSDPDKVRLMKAVRDELGVEHGLPSEDVQDLYREVFLKDVWTRQQRYTARGTAFRLSSANPQ